MNKMRLFFILMFCLLLAGACTDVELSDDTGYTNRIGVSFDYNWSNIPDDGFNHETADSMLVIAKRIVGAWTCGMKVNTADGSGYYLSNAPDFESEPIPEPEPDSLTTDSIAGSRGYTRAEGSQPGVDEPTSEFKIIPGLYKFITFNLDTTEYIYQDIIQYLRSEEIKSSLQELCMEYKRYAYTDSALRGKCNVWRDFNLYGDDGKNYIQPDITPIYYDSITNERISQESQKTLSFNPGLLTQNIDIRFRVRKVVDQVPFVIDSIYADISGIPYRLNLSNDYFDIKTTCKMMFSNVFEDANGNRISDSDTNTELYCHGNIDVLSVVNAPDSAATKGPGIMQVMVFVKGYPAIRGLINLYHCIRRANLIDDVGDGIWARKRKNHGVLQIDSDLIIDEKMLIDEEGDGGLDRWIPMDDQTIVIDT